MLTSYINHTIDKTSKEVPLDTPEFHPLNLATAEVALYEFHQSLHTYLSQPTHSTCPTLAQILTSPLIDPIAVGPTWQMAFNLSTSQPAYHTRLTRINHLKLLLAKLFAENELDGLVYPHQTVLVAKVGASYQPGRNGLLTSLTGTPGVVIPMGLSSGEGSAEQGIPAGMEVVGLWGDDWRILGIAMEIARIFNGRYESVLL